VPQDGGRASSAGPFAAATLATNASFAASSLAGSSATTQHRPPGALDSRVGAAIVRP